MRGHTGTRRSASVVVFLLTAGLFAGCQASNKGVEPDNKRAVVIDMPQEYDYSKKADYITQMNTELAKNREELERLTEKVANATGEAKVDAAAKLAAVRTKLTLTKTKLEQAEQSTEEQWVEMKKSFRASYEDMTKSFDEARQWIRDKLES